MADKKYVPQLKTLYDEKVKEELVEEFQYSSPMQLPRLEKVVVSMGVGKASENKRLIEQSIEIARLAGSLAHEIKNPISVILLNMDHWNICLQWMKKPV